MYEWKTFESKEKTLESMDKLLMEVSNAKWEIIKVDYRMYLITARKVKLLTD